MCKSQHCDGGAGDASNAELNAWEKDSLGFFPQFFTQFIKLYLALHPKISPHDGTHRKRKPYPAELTTYVSALVDASGKLPKPKSPEMEALAEQFNEPPARITNCYNNEVERRMAAPAEPLQHVRPHEHHRPVFTRSAENNDRLLAKEEGALPGGVKKAKVPELQQYLRERSKDHAGNKATLVEKVLRYQYGVIQICKLEGDDIPAYLREAYARRTAGPAGQPAPKEVHRASKRARHEREDDARAAVAAAAAAADDDDDDEG